MHVRVCRDCGEEYRPEAVRCADCGGELEDRYGDEADGAAAAPEETPRVEELSGHRVLFVTPRAADLVPMAERLREARLGYRLAEQAGAGGGAPSRFALLVKEEDAGGALRTLADLVSPHEEAEDLHALESRFDAEQGYLECPACGTATKPGVATCPECGLGLGGPGDEVEEPPD